MICSPIPALRAGLRALLSGDPGLEVVDSAASLGDLAEPGEDYLVIATPGGIDLRDGGLPAGLTLLLVAADPGDFDADLRQALADAEPRAWGLISPEATAEALQAAVRALAEGLVVLSPNAARQMGYDPAAVELPAARGLLAAGEQREQDIPAERLTEREVDVLREMARGLTNKQIAYVLKISEHTVKYHVSSIYGKLGAANRTEAVRIGARRGWIPL